MKYSIRMEGYAAQGNYSAAQPLGEEDPDYYSEASGRPEYWSCGLFDNEKSAREFLG